MKIDLKQLTGTQITSIPFSETLDLSQEVFYGQHPFLHPVHLKGTVSNNLGVLHLTGRIETLYTTCCVRCLKPLKIPLVAETDTILTHDATAEEDDTLFVLTEDSVEPADILVPALFLQVQMTYLCQPDCKGICPHCGANRNENPCNCDAKPADPRLNALRALLVTDKNKTTR